MPFLLILNCQAREKDFVIADLVEAGAQGLEELDLPEARAELRVYFGDEATTLRQAERFAAYSPSVVSAPEVDWVQVARSFWKPFSIGERFYLVPEWEQAKPPEGRILLHMFAGPAFGSGDHPTTQLCLCALERCVTATSSVLDVGCGTGILAAAAVKLGARRVYACDIDGLSVRFAAANFARERVPVRLFHGSVRSVKSAGVETVVANINTTTLELLSPDLTRIASRRLILSGFLEGNQERVTGCMQGFQLLERREKEGWVCLVLERS